VVSEERTTYSLLKPIHNYIHKRDPEDNVDQDSYQSLNTVIVCVSPLSGETISLSKDASTYTSFPEHLSYESSSADIQQSLIDVHLEQTACELQMLEYDALEINGIVIE